MLRVATTSGSARSVTAAQCACTGTIYGSGAGSMSITFPYIVSDTEVLSSGQVHAGYRLTVYNDCSFNTRSFTPFTVYSLAGANLNYESGGTRYDYRIAEKTMVTIEAYESNKWYLIESKKLT